MALFIALSFLMLPGEAEWLLRDLAIYYPLFPHEVAIAKDGSFHVLHFSEVKIYAFSADGKLQSAWGKKGQGPGEFVYPMSLSRRGDQLCVGDLGKASLTIYDPDGSIAETLKLPGFGVRFLPLEQGWLVNSIMLSQTGESSIQFFNHQLEEQHEVLRLGGCSQGGVSSTQKGFYYQPIRNLPIMRPDAKNGCVYVSHPDSPRFSVLDIKTGQVLRSFTFQSSRFTMDNDWLGRKKKAMKIKRAGMNMHEPFEMVAGDYFPIVRDFFVDPDGKLVINRWTHDPDRRNHVLVLDGSGKPSSSNFSWETMARLITVQEGRALVTWFDAKSETASLVWLPLDRVNRMVASNPIKWEAYEDARRIVLH